MPRIFKRWLTKIQGLFKCRRLLDTQVTSISAAAFCLRSGTIFGSIILLSIIASAYSGRYKSRQWPSVSANFMASSANVELMSEKTYVAAVAAADCWLAYTDPRVKEMLLYFTSKNSIASVEVREPVLQVLPSPRRSRRRSPPHDSSRHKPYPKIAPKPLPPQLAAPNQLLQRQERPAPNPPTPPQDPPQAVEHNDPEESSGVAALMSFIAERLRREGEANVEYMKILDQASLRRLNQCKSIAEYHASIVERRHDGIHLAGISLAILGENKSVPEFGHQLEKLEESRKGITHFASISAELVKSGLEIIVLITADRLSM